VELAVNVTVVTEQLKLAGGAMLTLGGVVLLVTFTEREVVHLLPGSVAVTVYVAATVTALVVPVPPPLHAKVAFGVVELAVIVIELAVHVKLAGGTIVKLGRVVLEPTVPETTAEQFPAPDTVTCMPPAAKPTAGLVVCEALLQRYVNGPVPVVILAVAVPLGAPQPVGVVDTLTVIPVEAAMVVVAEAVQKLASVTVTI